MKRLLVASLLIATILFSCTTNQSGTSSDILFKTAGEMFDRMFDEFKETDSVSTEGFRIAVYSEIPSISY